MPIVRVLWIPPGILGEPPRGAVMGKGLLVAVALFLSASLAAAQDRVPAVVPFVPGVSVGAEAPTDRLWASGDYLWWWFKHGQTPALASTGNLTSSRTTVLIGFDVDTADHSGGRFDLGYWLDPDQVVGIDGNFFFLGRHTAGQNANGTGLATGTQPLFGIPFLNAAGAESFRNLITAPVDGVGASTASAALTYRDRLDGAEANGLYNVTQGENLRLDLLGGFRFLYLMENLDFSTLNVATGPRRTVTTATTDAFHTNNRFYGGNLGARARYRLGGLFLEAEGKVALGDTHETVDIGFAGPGIFARPSNSGLFARDEFAAVSEASFNVGYDLTTWARATVGYTFLYASEVARPGDQIDRQLAGTG
ncbi:MAG: BBP7 family outer membrane beta-barrel protein, partial [Planctomycetes bacterium]|nr:BBP7 family outer membrane beta-barrel protein [Planctomycetota bacterium]